MVINPLGVGDLTPCPLSMVERGESDAGVTLLVRISVRMGITRRVIGG